MRSACRPLPRGTRFWRGELPHATVLVAQFPKAYHPAREADQSPSFHVQQPPLEFSGAIVQPSGLGRLRSQPAALKKFSCPPAWSGSAPWTFVESKCMREFTGQESNGCGSLGGSGGSPFLQVGGLH